MLKIIDPLVVFFTFGAFTFSDFYFLGVGRVFDYVLLASIIVITLVANPRVKRFTLISSLSLLFLLLPWLIAGSVRGWPLLSVAIILGLVIVFNYYHSNILEHAKEINTALRAAIVVNIVALLTQVIVKYVFDIYIDIHAFVHSIESRGWNEGLLYFRPSGLFQEPNAYCTAMFCLLSARILVFKSASWLELLGGASMILSLSLWGFGGSLVLLMVSIGMKKAVSLLLIAVFGFTVLFYASGLSMDEITGNSVTLDRLVNIADDPSRIARFGKLSDIPYDKSLIIGNGVNSGEFQSLAANSYMFLIHSFGLLGVLLVSIWGITFARIDLKRLAVILFLFTTFPLFSYMYFWLWLALMLSNQRFNGQKKYT